jgi:hypothetical protein
LPTAINLFVSEVLEADTKIGVSFALLQEQLLVGEISRSAFVERASPLGNGTSEAAAVGDKVLAIAANHAARQKELESSYDQSLFDRVRPELPAANRNGMF